MVDQVLLVQYMISRAKVTDFSSQKIKVAASSFYANENYLGFACVLLSLFSRWLGFLSLCETTKKKDFHDYSALRIYTSTILVRKKLNY